MRLYLTDVEGVKPFLVHELGLGQEAPDRRPSLSRVHHLLATLAEHEYERVLRAPANWGPKSPR